MHPVRQKVDVQEAGPQFMAGATLQELAQRYGVGSSTVGRVLRAAGYNTRRVSPLLGTRISESNRLHPRRKRVGAPRTDPMQCSKCAEWKPLAEFYPRFRYCKACHYILTERYRQEHREERHAWMVRYHRARALGMTLEEYERLGEPALICEICGATPNHPRNGIYSNGTRTASSKRLSIDHDHASGQRRGMLCGHCNRALGLAGDDPELLRKMARYLERYRAIT